MRFKTGPGSSLKVRMWVPGAIGPMGPKGTWAQIGPGRVLVLAKLKSLTEMKGADVCHA